MIRVLEEFWGSMWYHEKGFRRVPGVLCGTMLRVLEKFWGFYVGFRCFLWGFEGF